MLFAGVCFPSLLGTYIFPAHLHRIAGRRFSCGAAACFLASPPQASIYHRGTRQLPLSGQSLGGLGIVHRQISGLFCQTKIAKTIENLVFVGSTHENPSVGCNKTHLPHDLDLVRSDHHKRLVILHRALTSGAMCFRAHSARRLDLEPPHPVWTWAVLCGEESIHAHPKTRWKS